MTNLVFSEQYEELLLDCAVELEGDAYDNVKEVIYIINESNPNKVDYEDLIKLGQYVQKVFEADKKSYHLVSKLIIQTYLDNGFKTSLALIGNLSVVTINPKIRHALTEIAFEYHMKDQKAERELEVYDLVTTFGLGKGF